MIKLIGIALILMASTKIGADIAVRFRNRVKDMKAIKMAIEIIRNEMNFNLKPLDEVLEKASEGLPEKCKGLLLGKGDKCSFKPADKIKIRSFINSLGRSDIDTQMRNIDFFQKELVQMEEIAMVERDKYAKLALTLGICSGLVLALIIA